MTDLQRLSVRCCRKKSSLSSFSNLIEIWFCV